MRKIACLSLALAATILTAIGLHAQPASVGGSHEFQFLPASSSYGRARVIKNISYVNHPTARQNFDLYLPAVENNRPFPFIIWIHGGAWMMGIKSWDNVKYLVRHGYAIASIDYRVSTEARFPAQIQDCNAALNFILRHASEYNLDTNRLVIGGASAGGHLALLLGMARQERDFGADPAVKPSCILDFFGPTDLYHQLEDMQPTCSQKGMDTIRDAGTKLFGQPVEAVPDEAKIASPVTYVNAASPPVLILQGSKDDLVPVAQSRRLQAALNRAGVKNQFVLVQNAGHDGPLFSTPKLESQVIGFLNTILQNPTAKPLENAAKEPNNAVSEK